MKIPMGEFGNALIKPQSGSVTVRNAGAVGEALQRVGYTGSAIAENLIQAQNAEEKKAAAAAEKAREEADRATAAGVLVTTENGLADLQQKFQQDISTGKISKDEAMSKWREESSNITMEGMRTMPQSHAEIGKVQLDKFSGSFTRDIDKAVFTKNVEDVKGGLLVTMEGLERQAMRDLPGSIARVDEVLDSVGPSAQLSSDDIAKMKQGFREKTSCNLAYDHIHKNRENIKALSKIEGMLDTDAFSALDPHKKSELFNTIETYKAANLQKAEAAANRAERENERRLRSAEASFNTFQALSDKGSVLDSSYVDRVLKETAGTPFNQGIKIIAQQAKETGGIAMQPIKQQQSMLDAIDQQIATNGRSPALDKRREQVAKVVNASKQDLDNDPLRASLERGIIPQIAPLDLSNPQNFATTIGSRLQQADTVSMWAGKTVSPLDSSEASGLRDMLSALQPKAKSQAMSQIAASMPPKYASALALQLDKDDRALGLAFNFATAKTTGATNFWGTQTVAPRNTSELIIKGSQAIKDGTVMKDDAKVTGWKATIANKVEGIFPNQNLSAATKDATYLILAGIAQENGGKVGSDDIDKAFRLAIGGEVINHNGKRLPAPAGIDEEQLDKRLRSLTAEDMQSQVPDGKVRAGGVEVSLSDFLQSLPGQELMFAGHGRYSIQVRGRPVVNSAGKPIYIGVQ
jgi:hypothetical protein